MAATFRRRRRPGRRRCIAPVMPYPSADEDQSVDWYCSVRDDNGLIQGCQNNLWEGFAETEQTT
jgi:hypothetical protein